MGGPLALIPKPWRKTFFALTRKGKVDKLAQRNKLLESNTALVSKKYAELSSIEKKVGTILERLEGDKYEAEIDAINELKALDVKERAKFKSALFEIRRHGIEELRPISVTAQRIRAHMLVTLNKANVQRSILESKTSLASNAVTQLETLNLLDRETANINTELASLLKDLDKLNTEAIDEYSSLCESMEAVTGKASADIIGHITEKHKVLKQTKEELKKVIEGEEKEDEKK
jgi:predicted O-linked N-acetylglucosamine transferase (SPINDLY family)